jgi:acetyl-CoA synthetase
MTTNLYAVPKSFASNALVQWTQYQQMYAESVEDPDGFWRRVGHRLDWLEDFTRVKHTNFSEDDCQIRWFDGGKLNVASNCLDRHLRARGDKTAIIWEGDEPADSLHISYRELHERVCNHRHVRGSAYLPDGGPDAGRRSTSTRSPFSTHRQPQSAL